jgi:hypothetical protein
MRDRLAIALVLVGILSAIHTRILYVTARNHYHGSSSDADLFDLGHRLLPDLHRCGWWLNSLLPVGLLVVCALSPDRGSIYKQALRYLCPLILARMVTSLLTIPPPIKRDHTCRTDHPTLLHYVEGHCFDFMFSGHTAVTVALSVALLGPRSVFTWVAVLTQMVILLLTRAHYTIDVVVSAAVACMFFRLGVILPE